MKIAIQLTLASALLIMTTLYANADMAKSEYKTEVSEEKESDLQNDLQENVPDEEPETEDQKLHKEKIELSS